jgi:outer membrane receptor protein involved in Fe transport
VNFDNSGTNNISIRGISSTGGAGTTGIYLDDTPIQMRALAFNPDEALPKSFDVDRVEILRGLQGTLFGAGSEGGTVRYITTQPSLTQTTIYSREEIADTQYGAPSYETGAAIGGPLVQDVLGARVAVSWRRDGGWINDINPVTFQQTEKNANFRDTLLIRLAALWQASDKWSLTPGIYYQDAEQNDINNYWPIYSNPSSGNFVNADPTQRRVPDRFYLASLKVTGDLGAVQFISNTAYYHRKEQDGYEGTLYNLGFYQTFIGTQTLVDANGIHLPAGAMNYTSPSTVDNGQQNITQEFRLQSSDPAARLLWTTGVFATINRQSYLEQIHDPMLNELTEALTGMPFINIFGVGYDPNFPQDSYFLSTRAKDEQYAVFGEATYSWTDQWKTTVGAAAVWAHRRRHRC